MNDDKAQAVYVELNQREEENCIRPKQSANSLFRFFKNPEYLYNSLKNQAMIPRYYDESVKYLNIPFEHIAYPMVCFCDIPFHKLNDHMSFYGEYGIAFDKPWGISRGVQPIHYINKESFLCKDFSESFNLALKEKQRLANNDYLLSHMYFMKPIEGYMIREGKNEKRLFTDECEWRYIPDVSSINLPPVVTDNNIVALDSLNKTIEDNECCWLKFDFSDIKYIILKRKEDLKELYKVIESSIKSNEDKILFMSKVIIWDNAKEDF